MGSIDADAHVVECESTFNFLEPEFCDEYWDRWTDKNIDMMKECIFFGVPSEMAVLRKYYNDVERLDVTFPIAF